MYNKLLFHQGIRAPLILSAPKTTEHHLKGARNIDNLFLNKWYTSNKLFFNRPFYLWCNSINICLYENQRFRHFYELICKSKMHKTWKFHVIMIMWTERFCVIVQFHAKIIRVLYNVLTLYLYNYGNIKQIVISGEE